MKAKLQSVRLPSFGAPDEQPQIPAATYAARFAALMDRARTLGLDAALVYGDREHAANLSFLTGFDPRFEEALLVAPMTRPAALLAGPENVGSARAAALPLDVRLYPPFGLMGQAREKTPPLADLLRSLGLGAGQRIGLIGWKYFGRAEAAEPEGWFTEPAYIVDTLRTVAGPSGRLVNATALLMHASDGLRAVNDIDQLAAFEFAACHTSDALLRVIRGLTPGLRETEAAALMAPMGLPLNCHPMLSAGPRAALGLGSPGGRVIERGDPITMAFGVWGALNARAGFVAADAGDLPGGVADYVEKLVTPYFLTAAQWWETVGIGVTGGEIDALVKRRLGDPFFGVGLNPGHLLSLDEWMNTPIYPGSTERLSPGQALQLDIIPATGTAYFTSNIEDGLALLDARGRAEFAERYPAAWARIEARRAFMTDVIGIRLKPEVLPFSNMPGWLAPYLLSPGEAMVVER